MSELGKDVDAAYVAAKPYFRRVWEFVKLFPVAIIGLAMAAIAAFVAVVCWAVPALLPNRLWKVLVYGTLTAIIVGFSVGQSEPELVFYFDHEGSTYRATGPSAEQVEFVVEQRLGADITLRTVK